MDTITVINEEALAMLPDGIDLGLAVIDNDTAGLPIRFSASQPGSKRLQPCCHGRCFQAALDGPDGRDTFLVRIHNHARAEGELQSSINQIYSLYRYQTCK